MSSIWIDTDVVVIGAGAAGLAAAKTLASNGREFAVLEASHRIGGRAYTEDVHPGAPFDLGAHWIHSPTINPLFSLANAEGSALEEEDEEDYEFYTVDAYFEDGAWLPGSSSKSLGQFVLAQFERVEAAMEGGEDAAVVDLIDNDHRWAPYLHLFFGQDFTCDVDQISAADGVSFEHHGNDYAVVDGMGRLLQCWGASIPVELNAAVRQVDWSGDRIRLQTARGEVVANQVILTVSTGVLANRQIEFVPALPADKQTAIGDLPMGSCTRIAIAFDSDVLEPWPADFTIKPNDQLPLHFRNRPFGYDYVEVVTGGRFAEWMEKVGEQATIDLVLDYLAEIEPDRRKLNVTRRIVSAWDGDPWTRGSYSYARPGKLSAREALAQPIDQRLFFAGEACVIGQQATVHGAMQSGTAVANAL